MHASNTQIEMDRQQREPKTQKRVSNFPGCYNQLDTDRAMPQMAMPQIQKPRKNEWSRQTIPVMLSSSKSQTQRTVVVDKITALQDKALDDAVKGRVLVPGRLLVPEEFAGAELPKIFAGLGAIGLKQFHLDPSEVGGRARR